MKYTAVIFDMDGTIIDTGNIWFNATKQLIINHGIEYTNEAFAHIHEAIQGMATHEACLFIKKELSLSSDLSDLITQKSILANNLYQQELRFIEGFEIFFKHLTKNHTQDVAIATNATEDTIHLTNQSLKLHNYFGKHVYGIQQVNNKGKPDPAIFLYAADKLGVDPSECIVIEDSAHGINAAKAAGMYCIGINTAQKPDQLRNADRIVQGYHELNLDDLF